MISQWGAEYVLKASMGLQEIQSDWYVALCWSSPTQFSKGDTIPEIPILRNYSRAVMPSNTLTYTGGVLTNSATIQYNTNNDPVSAWQAASYFALCTATQGGEVLGWERLLAPVVVQPGLAPYFRPGGITITLVN